MDIRELHAALRAHEKMDPRHVHGIMEKALVRLARNYYTRAYRSAMIVGLTAGAWTTAALDAETEDADACFNTTTYTFTAPATGLYHLSYGLNLYNTSGGAINAGARIYLGGATVICQECLDGMPVSALAGAIFAGSDIRRLTKGDTLVLQYYSSSAACNLIGGAGLTYLATAKM